MLKVISKQKETNRILEICRKCYSFKYEDQWHFERPSYFSEHKTDEKIFVRFTQCPSCVEETLASYDIAASFE